MSLVQFARTEPLQFEEFVSRLRRLGVTRIDGLELGPLPRPELASVRERDTRTSDRPEPRDLARRMHETMFAASSVRPPLPEPVAPSNVAPRAIVQRRARDEGGRHGEGSSS